MASMILSFATLGCVFTLAFDALFQAFKFQEVRYMFKDTDWTIVGIIILIAICPFLFFFLDWSE